MKNLRGVVSNWVWIILAIIIIALLIMVAVNEAGVHGVDIDFPWW